jgi:endonuclease YncB( thermonuclease family)
MHKFGSYTIVGAFMLTLMLFSQSGDVRADVFSYAIVQPDASLKIEGRIHHLIGIYIPNLNNGCTLLRLISCEMQQAAQALRNRISGFVRCQARWRNGDDSFSSFCSYDYEDLGAYLVKNGFAAAGPDGPVEYRFFEEHARRLGIGIWGPQNFGPAIPGYYRSW